MKEKHDRAIYRRNCGSYPLPTIFFCIAVDFFFFLVCVKKSSSEFHFKVEVWNVWLINPVLLGVFDKELLCYSIFLFILLCCKEFLQAHCALKTGYDNLIWIRFFFLSVLLSLHMFRLVELEHP